MAIGLINIEKTLQEKNIVTYKYYTIDSGVGFVTIDRGTGDFNIIQIAEGDFDYSLSKRVYWALIRHFEEGDLPEKTCWAS